MSALFPTSLSELGQFQMLHDGRRTTLNKVHEGRAVVLTSCARDEQDLAQEMAKELENNHPSFKRIAVADLSAVPRVLRPIVLQFLRATYPHDTIPMALDFNSRMANLFGAHKAMLVLVTDNHANIVHSSIVRAKGEAAKVAAGWPKMRAAEFNKPSVLRLPTLGTL